jgi:hypothetical protein
MNRTTVTPKRCPAIGNSDTPVVGTVGLIKFKSSIFLPMTTDTTGVRALVREGLMRA